MASLAPSKHFIQFNAPLFPHPNCSHASAKHLLAANATFGTLCPLAFDNTSIANSDCSISTNKQNVSVAKLTAFGLPKNAFETSAGNTFAPTSSANSFTPPSLFDDDDDVNKNDSWEWETGKEKESLEWLL